MTQAARGRCDVCGGERIITPTDSPWEFDWKCPCSFGVISWAHRNPPPTFERDQEPQQQELFDAVMVER